MNIIKTFPQGWKKGTKAITDALPFQKEISNEMCNNIWILLDNFWIDVILVTDVPFSFCTSQLCKLKGIVHPKLRNVIIIYSA